jgi:hypothetical protein
MTIETIIKTKQKTSHIEKLENGTYKIYVKASPIEGKANIEIIKLLSKYFKVPQSNINIKLGKKTGRKIIEII